MPVCDPNTPWDVWKTINGESVSITEMTDDHLRRVMIYSLAKKDYDSCERIWNEQERRRNEAGQRNHVVDLSGFTLAELEQQAYLQAMQRHKGNRRKAAEDLRVALKTVYNQVDKLIALGLWTDK